MAYPSEKIAVVATIDPDANTAATYTSDWVNMENFHQLMAIVQVGIIAAGGTVDAKLMQATSSTGAGAKAISTANAQITQVTTAGNDTQQILTVRTDALDVAGGFSFVALRMTHTTAAGDSAGLVLGINPRYAPADDLDLASVSQIKNA